MYESCENLGVKLRRHLAERAFRLLAPGLVCALTALAHYTWITPAGAGFEPGRTVTVSIGHGHAFPRSEEAVDAGQLEAFVLTPSGARVKLAPAVAGSAVSAVFEVKETGLHRIAFTQDRGVTSRTPGGVRPGGRERNPDAVQASRTLRTAVAYAVAGKGSRGDGKPVGLEFELAGEWLDGAWSLRLLSEGNPVAGAAVEAFHAGSAKPMEIGRTGSDGRLSFRPAAGSSGPALFAASLRARAPAGADYDFLNRETSLTVSW
jgi:uncharacterized GH25 family protein